jgi:3',5'-cyclic AMP phosphodiesterase CpdA
MAAMVSEPSLRIVHISDLHFGDSRFVAEWGRAVAARIEEACPAVTVVTGDLTAEGTSNEYEQADRFLAHLPTGVLLVVPGEHDARNGGLARFEEVFGTRCPVYEDDAVVICGIDSSQPQTEDDHAGSRDLARIADVLSPDPRVRILATHHGPIPSPATGRECGVPDHADDVTGFWDGTEVDLVLTGHQHRPFVRRRGSMHVVAAGTATLRRPEYRSFPSFNVIAVGAETIRVQLVDVAGGWGTQTIATRPVRREAVRTDG